MVKFNPTHNREAQTSVRAIVAPNRVSAINNAVAIGPVTGPLAPWLLVRQLVTWSSTNQIHAIFMRSTMRFVPYLHSSRIAVSSAQSDRSLPRNSSA